MTVLGQSQAANEGNGLTLRWRLTLFYMVLLTILLTVLGVSVLVMMRTNLQQSLDRSLAETYTSFAEQLAVLDKDTAGGQTPENAFYTFPDYVLQVEELPFDDEATINQKWNNATSAQERLSVAAELRQYARKSLRFPKVAGSHLVNLTDEQMKELISAPDGRMSLVSTLPQGYNGAGGAYRYLVVLGPLQLELGAPPSYGIVYIGRSMESLTSTIDALQRVIFLLFLVGLGIAGLGAYMLAGQALAPLRQVQRAAENIGGQNLGARVPEPGTGDEVDALAKELNAMLGRLEASFESQRRFTSDASHELRTPVTAISGHASYLLRRTDPSEQQRESLNIIRNESERLSALIANLLQLARSDSGVLTMNKEPVFSTMFFSEIVRELRPIAHNDGAELLTEGQDIAFEADPNALKQVVINLVSNALKAGATRVTLSALVAPGADAAKPEVCLSIADNGPGIPADQLERLFDRFYRLQDSRSRDKGGAGLGLSIARGIVDAHQGKIWLESVVGEGTTAYVQLPVGDVPELDDDVP